MSFHKKLLCLCILPFPWWFRKLIYVNVFDYKLAEGSFIGLSFVDTKHLSLGRNTRIGHLNVIKGLQSLVVDEMSSIGNLNWITGLPLSNKINFFHNLDRQPSLKIGRHSSITNRHLIDCTHTVTIGNFSTFAGFRSQILTHSIDIYMNIQNSKPVSIGDYSFVGTASILLPGSTLPSYSVLAAGSVLSKSFSEQGCLYGGVAAQKIKKLPLDSKYFQRAIGRVQ